MCVNTAYVQKIHGAHRLQDCESQKHHDNRWRKCRILFGWTAREHGISVKIIEENKKRCEELSVLLPRAIIINGDGTDQETLNDEGLAETESFVSLTGIDEENILLTLHARKHSNAKTITKINRSNFREVINSLDL